MDSLGLLLHNAAQHLKREFERQARPQGLTLLQWRVLANLSRGIGPTQKALGTDLEVSPMSISDVLERLEVSGLISREPDPSDSRAKVVRITVDGLLQVDGMREIAEAVYAKALMGIGDEDRAAMFRGLTRIATNLEGESAAETDAPQ